MKRKLLAMQLKVVIFLIAIFFANNLFAVFPPPELPDIFPAPSDEQHLYAVGIDGVIGDGYIVRLGAEGMSEDLNDLITLNEGDIGTINGSAVDTATGLIYIVVRGEGFAKLIKFSMNDGVAEDIGDLGDNFAAIAFDESGVLYGLTGDGADTPASFYRINKETAETELLASYEVNYDGETLAFNSDDGMFYRATGNDMYKIDKNDPTNLNVAFEDNENLSDNVQALVHVQGNQFYLIIEWNYLIDMEDVNTGEFDEGDIYDMDTEYKGLFFWNVALSLENTTPIKNSNTAAVDTDLSLQFSNAVVAGNGNIEIHKYDDDSLIETIDITSDNVTGWNANSLDVDLVQTLENDTKYYVLIDNTGIVNFSGIDNKDDWSFTTLPDGNDFDFVDDFETDNFVNSDETDAIWNNVNGTFSLEINEDWTNADRITEGKEDVQGSEARNGDDPKIALDDDENQMIVYEEDNSIKFTRWNGENWVAMNGTLGDEDISTTDVMCVSGCREAMQPQIFVNDEGNPVVAWIGVLEVGLSRISDVFLRVWDGNSWVTMNGTIDADKLFNDELPYWDYGFHMVPNSNGEPMIVTTLDDGSGNYEAGYTEWNGVEWDGKTSSIASYDSLGLGGAPRQIQLNRDVDNNPMIVYVDNADSDSVHFSHWNGAQWSSMDGLGNNDRISGYSIAIPKIEIDSDNNPVLAFSDFDGIGSVGISRWDGNNWVSETIGTGESSVIHLELDSEGMPAIAWINNQMDIHFSKLNGEVWEKMDGTNGYDVVDMTGHDVQYMDMDFTSDNYPMIVWSMQEWSSTHFKMWNGESWTAGDRVSLISDSLSGDVRTYNLDMVINTDNEPSVVWGESSISGEIKFSILSNEITSPATIQSEKINGSIKDITKATLTVDEILEGESRIEYFLSIDGGITWIQVNSGEELTFDEKGDDLMWKAILYKGSVPTLNGVNVDYSIASVDPPTPNDPECGSNAKEYNTNEINFTGNFCEVGSVNTEPSFPNQGESVNWNCTEESNTINCSANRKEDAPDPVDPIDPEEETKECTIDNIKEITTNSATLRVSVDDSYANDKVNFRIEVENLYTDEKEIIKMSDKPSDNGKSALEVDNLEEGTEYRFKVSYKEKEEWEYCPHSKTATTEEIIVGPIPNPVSPECGSSEKTYKEDELKFTGNFCRTGEVLNIPTFPNQGEKISWTCTNDNEEITCSASREQKEIITPPVVQGGSEPEAPDTPQDHPTPEATVDKEKPYQVATVVGLATGVILALATTTIPLFTTIPMSASDIFIMPFIGVLARRKNEQNWGTVFEQTTKQPLLGVKLTLTDVQGNEIETTYSDQHGRFGFLTTNGTYLIHPEKAKYEEDLSHNHDSLYGDVYSGQSITIEENKVLTTNIAMNAKNINWNEYANKKVKSYTGTFSLIKKWSFIIIFYIGFIATAAITYLYPSILNFIFLTLYIVLFIYDNFIKQKKYGTVTKNDKNPVPFAVVSLHDKDTNQKTGFAVTDAIGRYYLLAENGDYNMKVKGQPISGQPFEKQGNINVKKGLVREDVEV